MFKRILVVLVIVLGTADVHAADRVALVIGNSAYKFANALPNPSNDAQDFAGALQKIGFDVIEGHDLDRVGMENMIRQFSRKLDQAKIAVFFYAGHGLQVNGKNYLVPIDAKLERAGDLNFDTIEIGSVLDQMEAEKRVNLIFLDACRDNPLSRSLARSMATRSAAVGQGLAGIQSGIGSMIAFSTQPDNVALDGAGRNSPFTAALLRHIGTQGLDISIVMRRVRTDVTTATNDKQVPWDNSSLTGEVVLVPGASPPETVAALPPSPPQTGPDPGAECDRLAADPFSLDKPPNVPGVVRTAIKGQAAVSACRAAIANDQGIGRYYYQLARALRVTFETNSIQEILFKAARMGSKDAAAENGYDLFFAGKLPEARQAWEDAAKSNNPDGIYYLGYMYNIGKGVPQDFLKARGYYERAAALGHGSAMNNLGMLYDAGNGVRKDQSIARQWLEKAAAAGDETGMSNLAHYYEQGLGGLPKNSALARQWYEKAALLGDGDAKIALQRMK